MDDFDMDVSLDDSREY